MPAIFFLDCFTPFAMTDKLLSHLITLFLVTYNKSFRTWYGICQFDVLIIISIDRPWIKFRVTKGLLLLHLSIFLHSPYPLYINRGGLFRLFLLYLLIAIVSRGCRDWRRSIPKSRLMRTIKTRRCPLGQRSESFYLIKL